MTCAALPSSSKTMMMITMTTTMMTDSSPDEGLERFKVRFLHAIGGFRMLILLLRLNCTLDRRRLGLGMIGSLLALSAFYVFPLRFYSFFLCRSTSNLRLAFLTDEHQLPWYEPSCCHEWWLVQAVSSAGLCNTYLGSPPLRFSSSSSSHEENSFGHAYVFHPYGVN